MGDAHDVLFDDRTLVELGRDEVRGRADELDASLEGLVVRSRALEPRQERVMDVDDSARSVPAQSCGREDLHVASQDHEVHVVLANAARAIASSAAALALRVTAISWYATS